MPLISNPPVPPYLQTVRDLIHAVADIAQPESGWFPNGTPAVQFRINSSVMAEVATDGDRWYAQETTTDGSTGKPVSEPFDLEPFLPAGNRYSPQEAALGLVEYLTTRLCTIAQKPGLPIEIRYDAAHALHLIMHRRKGD